MEKPCRDEGSLAERPFSQEECGAGSGTGETDSEREFWSMADEEHLNEARSALDDGYRLDSDPIKTVWGRVSDAKKHLDAIKPGSSLHQAAKSVRRKIAQREKHLEHTSADVTNKVMVKQREMVARELGEYYVSRGILVDIELSGQEKMFLRLACPLFHEASVERIVEETKFLSQLKAVGFRRIIFDDTDENIWTYGLSNAASA